MREIRLGILVPSSNTVLEPLINAMVADLNSAISDTHTSVHYSRVRVTQVSLTDEAKSQFDLLNFLAAAELLVDAKVDAIAWCGTSAGWCGIQTDRDLCKAIETRFHIPATSSTLGLLEVLRKLENPPLGLVTPYIREMNDAIRDNFAKEGIKIVGDDQYLGIIDNHEIRQVKPKRLEEMFANLLQEQQVNVVTTYCTNLPALIHAVSWEDKFSHKNLILLDSVGTTMWDLLQKVNYETSDTKLSQKWGKIFDIPAF